MPEISVFAFSAYKPFFKAYLRAQKDNWGIMTKLAKAAGCQRPYLSKVLSGEAHLMPAQAYGLCRFWKFSGEETEYFLGLLEIERAGSSDYREYWIRKTLETKNRHENISKVVERNAAAGDEKDLLYYSSWYWTAIHILVSIPEYQTERAISERLALPIPQVRSVLETLEKWGCVRREKSFWKFGSREQHISKDSPLAVFHHSNWRQQAIANAQRRDPSSVHFTVVQSLSKHDYDRVKELVLDCIHKVSEVAGPSQEEKLMCFSCDFFEP
jgi:uncharacterized protein (TIGR02147 family)